VPHKGKAEKESLAVQVGEPWSEEIEVSVGTSSSGSRLKDTVLVGAAGVIGLQQIAFTAYGLLYSEAILKEMLGFSEYLTVAVILWAVGPKVGDKIGAIAKAITKGL
jgi:hypothetical protein